MDTVSVTDKPKNHGLPWPPEFVDHQLTVETEWKVSTMNLHKPLAGKSGAFVYLVNVDCASFKGFAILKLEKRGPWDDQPSEPKQLQLARSNSSEYANKHLPSLLHDFCLDSVTISLFSIAEDGLEYVQPLAMLDAESEENIQYVAERLVEWNSINLVNSPHPVTARQLLTTWLGYRIDPNNGGRIHDFMALCGVDESDSSLSAAGTVYPNPLAFCLTESFDVDIYPLLGQQHGDCHSNNILLRKIHEKDLPHFYLIDFALYHSSWPIFYDHAYLELSLLLEYVTLFDVRRWDSLLTYCGKYPSEADKTLLRPEDISYVNIVRSIRRAQETWSEKNHKRLRSSLESQQLLGRIAVGLNFANKIGLSESLRYKALIYAAHQLKEYYKFKKIPLPDNGKPLTNPVEAIENQVSNGIEDWQEIWQQCSEFKTEYVFVLVVGNGLSQNTEHLATLGRLPWSMVMDFDPNSQHSGLMAAAKAELTKRRGFHSLTPEQIVEVNFNQGALWLMVRGSSDRPDTLVNNFNDWRYGKIPAIGSHLNNLRMQISPRQLRVLFMFTEENERKYFETIAERVKEVFYEGKPKLILCRAPNLPTIGEEDTFINVDCTPDNLMEGLIRHLVMDSGDRIIYLPRRDQNLESDKIERALFGFKSDDLLNIGEDLEIIHPGLGAESALEATDGFLRGNTISWIELERGYDVKLEMYPDFRQKVIDKLESYTNETLELSHKPGAGGTTVARRLAWDLHREFPCAVLRKSSNSTAGRIASLYRLTHLPVLLIIEAGTLTVPYRERLYKAVRDENARSIFVYVKRTYDGKAQYQVRSPLSNFESDLFLKRYAQQDTIRMANMERLAHNDEMMPYRMPFFFGLYAFEENFTHVNSYVESHLSGLSDQSQTLLRFVALVSRFSQYPISRSILAAIARIDDTGSFSLNSLLGSNAAKLVIQDFHSGKITVRIIHPLIAEQILKLTISNVDWTKQLEPLSCDFINNIADVCDKDAEEVLDLVTQMFIQREYWSDGKRSFFAQIIQLIPNTHGQAKVLKTLTERFPQESHFWNHRGRHSNRILKEDYHEAENFLNKAIYLLPSDPLHHHALGMIYREEVKKILRKKEKLIPKGNNLNSQELDNVRGEIESLYILSEDSFSRVRNLNPDEEHGYVANVQMIFAVIESMRNMSGQLDYPSFFRTNTRVMGWLRTNLEKAKELLDAIIHIQGKDKSEYVSNYSAQYRGLLGDYEAMIRGLNELLANTDNDKPSLRRLITDCIRNHHQDNWQRLTNKNLERVRDLAMANIEAGEASHRDFINWLHSYRRLPGFDYNEVINIMENWSTYGDSLQAHYYLFIFHFIKWYKGLTTDTSNIRRHLDKINKSDCGQKWSYEWLAKFEGKNVCGLVYHNELGIWTQAEDGHKFFDQHDSLLSIAGVVTEIKNARSGIITIYSAESSQTRQGKMEAFFVPGTDFIKGRDESSIVNAYIGFSYNGLRAWKVSKKR